MVSKLGNKTTGKLEMVEFRRWFNFLTYINEGQKNVDLISHYFFSKLSKSPEHAYRFIKYFENKICTCKDVHLKQKLANKYLEVISQLCERFGFFEEKQVLDDLCFMITDPKQYQKINKMLKSYRNKSKEHVAKILRRFKNLVNSQGYKCKIIGRYKNIYSVNRKLQKKAHDNVIKLNDIFAFRIILEDNSIKHCFEILDLLHEQFYPIVDLFKDYITIPKINGYQSLHSGLTNVIPNLDLPIEVQIRTRLMDDFAEKGFAAHWFYAKDKKSKQITDKKKKIMDHFSTYLSKNDDTKDMIYFFSYDRDMFRLENGSSALDFAYHIHTDLGDKAKSVIVNGIKQRISYRIQEGDKIEIIKSSQPRKIERLAMHP